MIEVGPSMHGVLPEVEKVCCLLAQKKVCTSILLFVLCRFTFLNSICELASLPRDLGVF